MQEDEANNESSQRKTRDRATSQPWVGTRRHPTRAWGVPTRVCPCPTRRWWCAHGGLSPGVASASTDERRLFACWVARGLTSWALHLARFSSGDLGQMQRHGGEVSNRARSFAGACCCCRRPHPSSSSLFLLDRSAWGVVYACAW